VVGVDCFGLGCGSDFVAVFLEVNDFADEAGENVEEAGVFEGIFDEFIFERRRGDFTEEFEILAGDDLKAGFGKGEGVIGSDHFVGSFVVGLNSIETVEVSEVALVTGGSPAGDVHFVDRIWKGRVSGLVEFNDDFFGRDIVVEHGVNEVAEVFR
jgi:hypothetical protein